MPTKKKIFLSVSLALLSAFVYVLITSAVLKGQETEGAKDYSGQNNSFKNRWSFYSETSGVLYWQLEDISMAA
ncbi:MAG: hypothetical protein KAQ62_18710, partial [Cyclobacteriaceae bacterium]|nr:hypothetical protein [Cyclobacteriaceae bacterium]